jgi:hypothetical protein
MVPPRSPEADAAYKIPVELIKYADVRWVVLVLLGNGQPSADGTGVLPQEHRQILHATLDGLDRADRGIRREPLLF